MQCRWSQQDLEVSTSEHLVRNEATAALQKGYVLAGKWNSDPNPKQNHNSNPNPNRGLNPNQNLSLALIGELSPAGQGGGAACGGACSDAGWSGAGAGAAAAHAQPQAAAAAQGGHQCAP